MRIQTLAGQLGQFALRPDLWPYLARWLSRRVRTLVTGVDLEARRAEEAKRAGTAWCAPRARDATDALASLGISVDIVALETLYPEEMADAARRVETVPFRLGGASNMDLIHALCEGLQATRVIETGVANGWSSLAVLLSISKRSGAALHSVDMPYLKYRNDRWVGIAVPAKLRRCWTLHRMADRTGLPRALKALGEIDVAHYDSDKSEAGRLFAYPLLWQALRSGGILFSDDIDDNLGFCKFCDSIGQVPAVVRQGGKFQGMLRKP